MLWEIAGNDQATSKWKPMGSIMSYVSCENIEPLFHEKQSAEYLFHLVAEHKVVGNHYYSLPAPSLPKTTGGISELTTIQEQSQNCSTLDIQHLSKMKQGIQKWCPRT